ncbi:hypothetical protein [Lacticaseibacillus saniviri]|uniref:hypothetical protein n=1 Tax=Lacticaseibacillus saniviri TaxID=931533 RepID=UPI0006CF2B54|nr:hypothetical protein [Lacticaseibacillus saniviri]MCG4281556.1 hypothetical protein [Lacticaseibacillus saniviri]
MKIFAQDFSFQLHDDDILGFEITAIDTASNQVQKRIGATVYSTLDVKMNVWHPEDNASTNELAVRLFPSSDTSDTYREFLKGGMNALGELAVDTNDFIGLKGTVKHRFSAPSSDGKRWPRLSDYNFEPNPKVVQQVSAAASQFMAGVKAAPEDPKDSLADIPGFEDKEHED